jgi:hypothetical protein
MDKNWAVLAAVKELQNELRDLRKLIEEKQWSLVIHVQRPQSPESDSDSESETASVQSAPP